MRNMIDCTSGNLPTVLQYIKQLAKGNLVAGYDTGSSNIVWTPQDWGEIPSGLVEVRIDQDFTGSPQPSANVIDCESGAWQPGQVDTRMAIATSPRPTVYASLETLDKIAQTEKWRGDVWVVQESNTEPTAPPTVPEGFTAIGQQWYFGNPSFDGSVVFDSYWPERHVAMPGTPKAPPGQWLDAQAWSWQEAVIIGRGLNNQLYGFAYDEATGEWASIPV